MFLYTIILAMLDGYTLLVAVTPRCRGIRRRRMKGASVAILLIAKALEGTVPLE